MLEAGEGDLANAREAAEWYRKAGESKKSEGCEWLGVLYCEGCGVEKDLEAAKMWFVKAIEFGSKTAARKLKALDRK
jgi:TPR repeat protein